MRVLAAIVGTAAKAMGYLIASLAIVLAGVLLLSRTTLEEALTWSFEVNGIAFTGLLIALTLTAVFCWLRLRGRGRDDPAAPKWLEAGIQAANGITTVALTFTLLSVSLGLSSLAGRQLSPETIPGVIHDLTGTFALAFLTTVVGQPVAALLRTLLMVTHALNQERESAPAPESQPEASPATHLEPVLPPLAEPPAPEPPASRPTEPKAAAWAPAPAPKPALKPAPVPEPDQGPVLERESAPAPEPTLAVEPKPAPEPLPREPAPTTVPAPASSAPLPAMVYAGERA